MIPFKLKPFYKFQLFLLGSFFLVSCSASRVNHTLSRGLHSEVFENSFSGIAFYDPVKHKTLYEHNANKYFTPASNMKLFSFYAGLKILGDSVPALKYIQTNDSLIFTGTGDPAFLNPNLPASRIFGFLKMAPQQLYYYPGDFKEEKFGPGWSWDDYNYGFSAERSLFPIFGNVATIKINPATKKVDISPQIFRDSLLKSEDTLHTAYRTFEKNLFSYHIPSGKMEVTKNIPFKYSPQLFTGLLSDTLHRPVKLIKIPSGKHFNKNLFSISADSLYRQMLQQSDNFIAEQLLYMVSQKISDTSTISGTIKYIKKEYLKEMPQEPVWIDGSGLSRYNLVTPKSLVFLLNKIFMEVPQKRLFSFLPAGGKSGTLENQFKNNPPFIFAKSGSLSNNYNLSGYLKTKSGKTLIFSFMINHFVIPSAEIKKEMEKILTEIYWKY